MIRAASEKSLSIAVGLCVFLFFVIPTHVFAAPSIASTTLQLVNQVRLEKQVPPLTINDCLEAAARARAQDMIRLDYFSHRSPDGRLPWDFAAEQGYDYEQLGENLASGWNSLDEAVAAWMKSPTHRKNLLSTNFRETGIAAAYQNDQLIIVQLFGSPHSKNNCHQQVEKRTAQILTVPELSADRKESLIPPPSAAPETIETQIPHIGIISDLRVLENNPTISPVERYVNQVFLLATPSQRNEITLGVRNIFQENNDRIKPVTELVTTQFNALTW